MGSGQAACFNSFFIFMTRFAQMRVDVNEARSDELAGGVDYFGLRILDCGLRIFDGSYFPILYEDVHNSVDARFRVDNTATLNQVFRHMYNLSTSLSSFRFIRSRFTVVRQE